MLIPAWAYGAVGGAVFAFGVGVGAAADHHFMDARYAKLQSTIVAREAAAAGAARKQQKAQDDLTLQSALAEAKAQERIVIHTQRVIQEVPVYVTERQDATTCVTFGLVRVLDAAAQGLDPAELRLPAGQSDDACAPIKASDLARSVAENYGIARQNAEQLDALIADTKARVAASKEIPK